MPAAFLHHPKASLNQDKKTKGGGECEWNSFRFPNQLRRLLLFLTLETHNHISLDKGGEKEVAAAAAPPLSFDKAMSKCICKLSAAKVSIFAYFTSK